MSELMDATISYLDANPPAQVQAADRHPDRTLGFYRNIGIHAESDHGSLPIRTHDAREAHLPKDKRSFDIGYGHKLTQDELETGTIHGIPFLEGLNAEDKTTILNKDMENNLNIAMKSWEPKLKEMGGNWDELSSGYQMVLTSLAYNVGGTKAGAQWSSVLGAAMNQDVSEFAKQARRQDNNKNTAGMDNRVLKELYYSGLIDKASDVKDVLPLSDGIVAGIPL
jgi:GH24 family phage-related lysozyme (muramidase)